MTSTEKLPLTLRNERYEDTKAAADEAEQKLWDLHAAYPELDGLLDAIKLQREVRRAIYKMLRV